MTTTNARRGVPARDLSDAELEHQGTRAHATRHATFLHGTVEQFRHHTERMLELEQEYLRRHPKRTWQGTVDGADADDDRTSELSDLDRWIRVRAAFQLFTDQMAALLDDADPEVPAEPGEAERAVLARFAATPDGRLHKLARWPARSVQTLPGWPPSTATTRPC